MKYEGQAIQTVPLDGGFVELKFDLKTDSVNKFNALTMGELKEVVEGLTKAPPKGLLVTSGKDVFIVGADVTEFLGHFKRTEEELRPGSLQADAVFNGIEDLPCPSVVALNGFCLGGGFELALSAHFRAASTAAKVGVPETKLGIFPGWGGTVRLSRMCGADNAIEWIATGEQYPAEDGLKIGAVDAVCEPGKLREVALRMLHDAADGKLDWKNRRDEKKAPLQLNKIEAGMVFEGAKAFVGGKAGPNYPSPVAAIEAMQKGAGLGRDEALKIEAATFAKIAKTPTAHGLVSVFLGDQLVKKIGKKASKGAKPVRAGGGPRRRDHGGRHRLPVRVEGDADPDEGHRAEGARARDGRGGQAPREAGRSRQDDRREDGAGPRAGSRRPSPSATSAPSTSSSRRSSRTRRSRSRSSPSSRRA